MRSALVGDYALSLWDREQRRLFCARSVRGWRPFLWYCDGARFAFATEPRQIFDGCGLRRVIHEPALGELLALQFRTPTETLWKGIFRLPPGWAMTVCPGGQPRSWRWHQGPFPGADFPTEQAYVGRFRELFDQALRACLRSRTPVASHLSGGLDSSSVVCRALELFRDGAVGQPVRPISAVVPGQAHDESEWIRAVEHHTGVASDQLVPRPYDWDAARARTAQTLHLPLRPNVVGTCIAVCERLRASGVRVLLTGEGGDDWLSGSLAHWPDLLRRGKLGTLFHEAWAQAPGRPLRALRRIAGVGLGPWISRSRHQALLFPHLNLPGVPAWIRPEWARRIGLQDRDWPVYWPDGLPGLAQRQRSRCFGFARAYINNENVLAYAATQHVELRHPFHDRRLTEFLLNVPGGLLLHGREKKYLLRQAMRGTLPEVVRTRQTKVPFDSHIVEALSRVVTEQTVSSLVPVQLGWLDGQKVWELFTRFQSSGGAEGATSVLWFAVSVDTWCRHAAGA